MSLKLLFVLSVRYIYVSIYLCKQHLWLRKLRIEKKENKTAQMLQNLFVEVNKIGWNSGEAENIQLAK